MKVSIKDLLLDDKNYRFPFSMVDRSQNAIIKYLLNNEDAKKIVDSINAYGYLPNNALYIVKSAEGNDKYIVKEGNRRCASVKALSIYQTVKTLRNQRSYLITEPPYL